MEEKEKEFDPTPAEQQGGLEEAWGGETPEAVEKAARRNMLYGLLWCLGGLAFSFISYYVAEEGGRYVVTTGAIVYGAIQAFKGLLAYLQVKRELGDEAARKRAIVLAACTAAAVMGLSYVSWQTVHADDLRIVEEEQLYDCPELGLRMTIPAGFSEVETSVREETETSYALYRASVYNETQAVAIESTAGCLDETQTIEEMEAYLTDEAKKFFDGGIDERKFVTIGGIRMLKHVGTHTELPEWKTVMYDLAHDGSLITFYYSTQTNDPSRETDEFVRDRIAFY